MVPARTASGGGHRGRSGARGSPPPRPTGSAPHPSPGSPAAFLALSGKGTSLSLCFPGRNPFSESGGVEMCSFFLSKEPFLRTEVPRESLRGHHQPGRARAAYGRWGSQPAGCGPCRILGRCPCPSWDDGLLGPQPPASTSEGPGRQSRPGAAVVGLPGAARWSPLARREFQAVSPKSPSPGQLRPRWS